MNTQAISDSHVAYYVARDADKAFSAALRDQFGAAAVEQRYALDKGQYNDTTRRAWQAKRVADEALHAATLWVLS